MNKYEDKYLEELSKNDFKLLMEKSYLSNKQLSVRFVKGGVVLPPRFLRSKMLNKFGLQGSLHGNGGVIEADGNYVEISAQKAYGMRNRVDGGYRVNCSKVLKRNEKVIYLNYFIKQWGHFLLDVIGRLWYPLLYDSTTKIVYTSYTNSETKITGNYLELFKLLGIEESRLLMINKPTQFDEIIIPESSILPGKYYTKEYKKLFETLLKKINLDDSSLKGKKIYCSRSQLDIAKSKEFGELKIEKYFIDNGFEPVYMETMSLSDQIRTLISADTIVMTSGSLAHNLLFINLPINVFILNKTYRINLHQFMINDISEANIKFIDSYRSPLPILYGYGPFLIDITQPLRNFFNDNGFIYQSKSVLSSKDYFKYYFKWLCLYKFFVFRIKAIKEGNNKFEKDYKTIRKYYKIGRRYE